MGEVYRARDTRLGREVAIKVLPESLGRSPDALRRFHAEARAVAALSHSHILGIHDVGEHDGTVYAVMELLEGETLRGRLAASAIPSRKAVEYSLQIARGLAAAHDRGIVHRDLKPENVFLTKEGVIKILDFGLAMLTARPSQESDLSQSPTAGTQPGIVLGTPGYMSPEQVRGRPVDHRTDLFALGAILFEMLTGRRAFHGAEPRRVHAGGPPGGSHREADRDADRAGARADRLALSREGARASGSRTPATWRSPSRPGRASLRCRRPAGRRCRARARPRPRSPCCRFAT